MKKYTVKGVDVVVKDKPRLQKMVMEEITLEEAKKRWPSTTRQQVDNKPAKLDNKPAKLDNKATKFSAPKVEVHELTTEYCCTGVAQKGRADYDNTKNKYTKVVWGAPKMARPNGNG